MAFMGFYTHKEVEAIKRAVITDTKKQMKVEFNREKNHLIDDYESRLNSFRDRLQEVNEIIKESNEVISIASDKLKEKDSEIYVLKTFLKLECDKEIKRLETIAKRTKKEKIKKKCENRIIDYKMRKLAYE